jgi:hypothetical protein
MAGVKPLLSLGRDQGLWRNFLALLLISVKCQLVSAKSCARFWVTVSRTETIDAPDQKNQRLGTV